MTLKALFNKCLNENYITIPDTKADYRIRRSGTKLFLLSECSNQQEDWNHNFDFPAKWLGCRDVRSTEPFGFKHVGNVIKIGQKETTLLKMAGLDRMLNGRRNAFSNTTIRMSDILLRNTRRHLPQTIR